MWNSVCGWEGARDFDVLFTSDWKKLQRVLIPRMPLLADFMCSGRPLPHTESKSGMGKIIEKHRILLAGCTCVFFGLQF
jgi:hypothetical protein